MKKIIFILLLFVSFKISAQVTDTTQFYNPYDYGTIYQRLKVDSFMLFPRFGDTLNKTNGQIKFFNGVPYFTQGGKWSVFGSGTVTNFSVANGYPFSVINPTTTPQLIPDTTTYLKRIVTEYFLRNNFLPFTASNYQVLNYNVSSNAALLLLNPSTSGYGLYIRNGVDSLYSLAISNAANTVNNIRFFGDGRGLFNGNVTAPSFQVTGASAGSYIKADGTGYGTPAGGPDSATIAGYRIKKSVSGTAITLSNFPDTVSVTGNCAGTSYCNYTGSLSASPGSYTVGDRYFVKFDISNSNANDSINLNGLGFKPITKNGTIPTASGDIAGSQWYLLYYDGSNFQIVGNVSSAGTISGNLLFTGAAGTGNINWGASNFAAAHIGTIGGYDCKYVSTNSGGVILGRNDNAGYNGVGNNGGTDMNLYIGGSSGNIPVKLNFVEYLNFVNGKNIKFGVGMSYAYASKAANYTATFSDQIIETTATGTTITLPAIATVNNGQTFTIKNTFAGTATVAGNGAELIDGANTYSLSAQYKYVTVTSNGTKWLITGNN